VDLKLPHASIKWTTLTTLKSWPRRVGGGTPCRKQLVKDLILRTCATSSRVLLVLLVPLLLLLAVLICGENSKTLA